MKQLKCVTFYHFLFMLFIPLPASWAKITVKDDQPASGVIIVEGVNWLGQFSLKEGALLMVSKLDAGKEETIKIVPFFSEQIKADSIINCQAVQETEENVKITATFTAGDRLIQGEFIFDQSGSVQINPRENMTGILAYAPIAYGVIPCRYLNSDIYDPKIFSSCDTISLPAENIFMGLLKGENTILICAWPREGQKISLLLDKGSAAAGLFPAVRISLDGKSIYLGRLAAPGIWHEEHLDNRFFEKDVTIDWKIPFAARWQTQLLLGGEFSMTFPFLGKGNKNTWPIYGEYTYPVTYNQDRAVFHLSKKIPPCGRVLIYALEGNLNTPVTFARRYLADTIDVFKEHPRLPDRPFDEVGVNWCIGRRFLCDVFSRSRPGIQIRQRRFFHQVMDDFSRTFLVIKNRLEEYENFIRQMEAQLASWKEKESGKPAFQAFFEDMTNNLEELKTEYHAVIEDKTPQELYQHDMVEVVQRLESLFDDDNLQLPCPEVADILFSIKLWERGHHGGATTFGSYLVKWYQQTGQDYADNQDLVDYVRDIRKALRAVKLGCWKYEIVYYNILPYQKN